MIPRARHAPRVTPIQSVFDLRTPAEARVDPFRSGNVTALPLPKPPWTPQQQQQVFHLLRMYVPRGFRVAFVCTGGVLSRMATDMLRPAGYDVMDLGAMNHWKTRENLRSLGYWVDRW